MSDHWSADRKQYMRAMRDYVSMPDEVNLARAYELGRHLVGEESQLLEFVVAYHRELARLVRSAATPREVDRTIARGKEFFSESLSAVAMAQRGLSDTVGRLRDVRLLLEFQRAIAGARRISDVIQRVVAHGSQPLGTSSCALLRPAENGTWDRVASPGQRESSAASIVVEQKLVELAGRSNEPVVRNGVNDTITGDAAAPDAGSLLTVALRDGESVLGVLVFHAATRGAFGPAEVDLAQLVADYATQAIKQAELLENYAEMRASELALRETNRRMEEFLSIAGHELRTPLTSILGNMQLIAQWNAGPRKREQDEAGLETTPLSFRAAQISTVLQRMDAQGGVLIQLINDLLDVSRIKAGQLALRPSPCDLAALVREGIEEHRPHLAVRGIQIEVVNGSVPVIADAARIGQVLTNYLANALKYAPPTRLIKVGLRVDGSTARVWVSDEGPGVPVEEQANIWQRFYRVPGVRHRDGSSVGLGLGLHICQTIVERHGGSVGVDSAPGAGATFWFTLPLASRPAVAAGKSSIPARAVDKESSV